MLNKHFIVFLLFLIPFFLKSQNLTTGPENGTLLIIGGAAKDSVFMPIFQELVGGKEKEIVIIPTAGSDQGVNSSPSFERYKRMFKKFGFEKITVLHTRDPKIANTDAFVKPLLSADGVWFYGGRQWRLADAYLNTKVHLELDSLLDRGGVIAGSSAGATIQGSYLIRGDTKTNTIIMGDHEVGMGFIKNVAIDQHLLARNRQFDMFELLEHKPGLLGIGLDENTGIIVTENTFKVVGKSYVAIYDGTLWSAERQKTDQLEKGEQKFYLLKAGDQYDMKNRKVIPY